MSTTLRRLGWLLLCSLVLSPMVATAEDWGPSVDGLQMSLALRKREQQDVLAIAITIRNDAAGSVRLNLGIQIPGFQSPDHVGLTVVDARGTTRSFPFLERRYAGIAGGVSSFVIRLRPGERYTLPLTLDDFFWLADVAGDATSTHGKLILTASLESSETLSQHPEHPNASAPLVWLGKLRSNTLQLER